MDYRLQPKILGFEVNIVFSQIGNIVVLDSVWMASQPVEAEPCPFCGNTDLVIQRGEERGEQYKIPCFEVFCCECGSSGGSTYSIKKGSYTYRGVKSQVKARLQSALNVWNTRAGDR